MQKAAIHLIFFCLFSIVCKAQSPTEEYIKQPDLEKFAGTWKYSDDTIQLTLILKKEKVLLDSRNNNLYADLIQGDYILSKKGVGIIKSIQNKPTITTGNFDVWNKKQNIIKFIFTDVNQNAKRGQVIFELLDSKKAKWRIYNREHYTIGNQKFIKGFSVPVSMVLTKSE